MAWEWLDTLTNWADKGGRVLNALDPFLRIGGSIYDRNNTRGAINSAFDQYAGYADRSLGALEGVYGEGKNALRPYLNFGRTGVNRYTNLLKNPDQITNDPGYQFRFDQGNEALRRTAAKTGFRGSGNEMTALNEYGQNYATNELDKALNRYIPMINTGVTATGQLTDLGRNYAYGVGTVNNALGEAAAGREIGGAGADSRMVTDFLGMTGGSTNPFGIAADAGKALRTAANGATEIGNLTTAGGGNPFSAVGASVPGSGNGWALAPGPRDIARMPNLLANPGTAAGVVPFAGMAPAGMAPAWGSLPYSPVGAFSPAAGAGGATGAAAGAASSPYSLGSLGTAAGVLAMPFALQAIHKATQGGSVESAKAPKLYAQLQRDMQADPSGRTARQTLTSLVNGGLWGNEANGWVIEDLVGKGFLSLNDPLMYNKNSVVDLTKAGTPTGNKGSNFVFAQFARMSPEDYQKLNNFASPKIGNSGFKIGEGTYEGSKAKQVTDKMRQDLIDKYMPGAIQQATRVRDQILRQNPRADVTKLNHFIWSARNG